MQKRNMRIKYLEGQSLLPRASSPEPPWKKPKQRPYTGHFVVVRGYVAATDEFVYNDPAKPAARCIGADALDAARGVSGTDEDMLFVSVGADHDRACM